MKHHEREFFISSIRSGKVIVPISEIELVIKVPTIDQISQACRVYNSAYDQAYVDGMMNEDEMHYWMLEKGFWDGWDDKKIEGLKQDIEKLKIEIYNARRNKDLRETFRCHLRAGESQLISLSRKKDQYYQNTCEGFATTEKISWLIKNTTYHDNKKYDFSKTSLSYVVDEWQNSILPDGKVRELARNEPWKSFWVIRENAGTKLFANRSDQDLTHNQKNLIIWSQMYDNIQESMECPDKESIEDDDVLDGWFILQGKKREKERSESEFDKNTNEKIKNSSEVFVIANDKSDIDRVEGMNSFHSSVIKKQRESLIKQKGQVTQDQFSDVKLDLSSQSHEQFKGTFKKG